MPTSLFAVLALAFYLVAMKMALNLVLDNNFDGTPEGIHCTVLVMILCILVTLCTASVVNDILWKKWVRGTPTIFEALPVALVEVILTFFPAILWLFKFEIRKKIFW